MMIQLTNNFLQRISQRDKIHDIPILIERPSDLTLDAVVVPVQRFAGIAVKGDEMGAAEDKIVFFETDAVDLTGHVFSFQNSVIR
jgi:hypothetical protein